MKSKFKISGLSLLIAAGTLSIGLASCNGGSNNSTTTPVTSTSSPSTQGDHTVRFYDQNGNILATIGINDGEVIPSSSFPVIADDGNGHPFAGWYTTSGAYNESSQVTGNLNLQARFTFTVSFKSGDDIIGTQGVVSGYAVDTSKIPSVNAPDHYSFDRWLNGSSEYLMTSAVNSDITLTASFIYVLNGSGTLNAPFLLETKEDVYQFANLVNLSETHPTSGNAYATGYYSLSNDIALDDERLFTPIRNFSGTFQGNGHSISNINIAATRSSDIGFFATTFNATISNLKIEVTIEEESDHVSGSNIGSLIGNASSTTITGVEVSGSIDVGLNKLARATVGGLVGYGSEVTIDSCKITSNVFGGDIIGGVVGHLTSNSIISQTYVSSAMANYRTANIGCFSGYCDSTSLIYNSWFNGGFYTSSFTPADETSRTIYGLGTGEFKLVFTSDITNISTLPWNGENWDLTGEEPVLKIIPETHEQITVSYIASSGSEPVTSSINYGDSYSANPATANTTNHTLDVAGAYSIRVDGVDYIYNSDYPLYSDVTLYSMSTTYGEIVNTSWVYSENESISIVEASDGTLTVSGQLPTSDTSSVSFTNVNATIGGINKDLLQYSNGSYYINNQSYNTGAVYFAMNGSSYRVYIQKINERISNGTQSVTLTKGYLIFEEYVDNEWIMMTGQFNSPVIDDSNYTYYQADDNSSSFFLTAPYSLETGDYVYVAFASDGDIFTYLVTYYYSDGTVDRGVTLIDEEGNYVGEYVWTKDSTLQQVVSYATSADEVNDFDVSKLPSYVPSAEVLEGTYVAEEQAYAALQSTINNDTWATGEQFKDYDLSAYTYTILSSNGGFEVVYNNSIYAATPRMLNNGAFGLVFGVNGVDYAIAIYGDAYNGVSLLLIIEGNETSGETVTYLDSMDNYIYGIWSAGITFEGNHDEAIEALTIENQKITLGATEIENFTYSFLVLGSDKNSSIFALKFERDGITYYLTANYLDLAPLGLNREIILPVLYADDGGNLLGKEYNLAPVINLIIANANQSYITDDNDAISFADEENINLTRATEDDTYIITYGEDTVTKIFYNTNGVALLNGTERIYGFTYLSSDYKLTDSATFTYIDLSFEIVDGKYNLVIGENSYPLSLYYVDETHYFLQTSLDGGTTPLYLVYQEAEYAVFLCDLNAAAGQFEPIFGAINEGYLEYLISGLQGHFSLADSSGSIDITINNTDLTFEADLGTQSSKEEYTIYYDAINGFFFALTTGSESVDATFYIYKDGSELVYGYGDGSEVIFEPDGFYNFVGSWTAYSTTTSYTITFDGASLTLAGDSLNITFSSLIYDDSEAYPLIIGQALTDTSGLDSTYTGTATLTQIQILDLDSLIYVLVGEYEVTLNEGYIISVGSTTITLNGVVFVNDTLSLFNGAYAIEGYEEEQNFFVSWQDGALYITYILTNGEGQTYYNPVAVIDYEFEVTETEEGMVLYVTTTIDGHELEFSVLIEADGTILYGYEWDAESQEPATPAE